MARNGSGTYSKVNTFVAGTTITASGHNQNWDDIATEVTNSVAADGQTTMTGPLKAANGSTAAPAFTFGSDPDTGFIRSSANSVGIIVGGQQLGEFTPDGLVLNMPFIASATASFAAFGTATFVSTATFSAPIIASATAQFVAPVIMSATASFASGFIASATCTFAGELIASATATFTTRANIAGSQAVTVATQGWSFISTQTASSSATIDFTTGLDDTYDEYMIVMSHVVPASDDVSLYLRVGTGAGPTWQAGTGYSMYAVNYRSGAATNDSGAAQIRLTGAAGGGTGVGNAANETLRGSLRFGDPDSGDFVQFGYETSYSGADATPNGQSGIGRYMTAAALTGIRLLFSAGNIASGRFTLYGMRKA